MGNKVNALGLRLGHVPSRAGEWKGWPFFVKEDLGWRILGRGKDKPSWILGKFIKERCQEFLFDRGVLINEVVVFLGQGEVFVCARGVGGRNLFDVIHSQDEGELLSKEGEGQGSDTFEEVVEKKSAIWGEEEDVDFLEDWSEFLKSFEKVFGGRVVSGRYVNLLDLCPKGRLGELEEFRVEKEEEGRERSLAEEDLLKVVWGGCGLPRGKLVSRYLQYALELERGGFGSSCVSVLTDWFVKRFKDNENGRSFVRKRNVDSEVVVRGRSLEVKGVYGGRERKVHEKFHYGSNARSTVMIRVSGGHSVAETGVGSVRVKCLVSFEKSYESSKERRVEERG